MCDVTKPFGTPILVSVLSSPNANSTDLQLTKDYVTGYFDSLREGGVGNNDIWSTVWTDGGGFASITDVPVVNSTFEDAYPTVSGDGLTLIFESMRPGGAGGADLWVATRLTTLADFGAPSDLASVNSVGADVSPFLREDGQHLYLSSDRQPTAGSADLWSATVTGGSF